jgi:hypothetical protein
MGQADGVTGSTNVTCGVHFFVERDIDLLLAEELRVNPAFSAWMLGRCGAPADLAHPAIETRVSVMEDGSEADAAALFAWGNGRFRFFVEDKIDAGMMPEQLERYVRRAEAEQGRDAVQGWAVAFFTPRSYRLSEVPLGVTQITFEEAADALRRMSPDLRSDYRASLLDRAAAYRSGSAARSLYVAQAEPHVAGWWDEVVRMLDREFPSFFLPFRTQYPREVFFAPRTSDLANYLRIDLKGHKGEVDLAFKYGDHAAICAIVQETLGSTDPVVVNGRSVALRIPVARFTIAEGTAIIPTKVRQAFQAARLLVLYWRQHRARFDALF